jgi:TP901 family phage tail tape measure protein
MMDMANATNVLTTAQKAMGLYTTDLIANLSQLNRISDVFNKANIISNTSVLQLSEAIDNEAGTAIKNFNLDLEQSVAVLSVFADKGIKGSSAGTLFGRSMRLLTKAYARNSDVFK